MTCPACKCSPQRLDGSLLEAGTLIATDDLPRMQVLTTARSPTRYADTVYRNEYGWKVGPHYRYATNCHYLPRIATNCH